LTKEGTFHTSGKCKTNFILNEFYENKVIEWTLHVDKTSGPHQYDMIVGHDLMSQLGIILDFDGQTITWDKSTIKMKEYKIFCQALNDASSRLKKILDAKYEPADLDK
jgi:hypothetical protein